MKKKQFEMLLDSLKEGAEILNKTRKPSRKTILKDPDVRKIRKNLVLSQSQFARLMGISLDTLKNWEQGRRKPQGPARVLLNVVARHPEVFPEVVGLY